jgi:hypothetical protein
VLLKYPEVFREFWSDISLIVFFFVQVMWNEFISYVKYELRISWRVYQSKLMTNTESYDTIITLIFMSMLNFTSVRSQFPTTGLSWMGDDPCFKAIVEAYQLKCFFTRTAASKLQIHCISFIMFALIIFIFSPLRYFTDVQKPRPPFII